MILIPEWLRAEEAEVSGVGRGRVAALVLLTGCSGYHTQDLPPASPVPHASGIVVAARWP